MRGLSGGLLCLTYYRELPNDNVYAVYWNEVKPHNLKLFLQQRGPQQVCPPPSVLPTVRHLPAAQSSQQLLPAG